MVNRNTSTKVAIVGMGCTRFGDHWDKSADDLVIDAVKELSDTSGVLASNVDAFWLGTAVTGQSGLVLSKPLKLINKPITRVENM